MDVSGDGEGAKAEFVPAEVIFGYQKEQPRLSADGQLLAYLAPSPDGVLNVFVRPVVAAEDEAKQVTKETHRGVRWFIWSPSAEYIIYKQDQGGDEDWHHFAVDLATGSIRDLTPFENVHTRLIPSAISGARPYVLYFYINLRSKEDFDVYRINIQTGEAVLDTENPGDVSEWLSDGNGVIRGALAYDLGDGSYTIRVRDSAEHPWRDVLRWTSQDDGGMVGFAKEPNQMYILSSLSYETNRLLLISTDDGSIVRVIAEHPKCDIFGIKGDLSKVLLMDFKTKEYQAVGFYHGRLEWKVLDPSIQEDFDFLLSFRDVGQMVIGSRDRTNCRWVITYEFDNKTAESFLYDRSTKTMSLLFEHHPALKQYRLGTMHPKIIKTRDGLDVLIYLTLPANVEPKNLPLVLRIHGGPWFRDWWGFDSEAQFFASRGYACIQVEYRGSAGFGKKFLHAGDKQWAANMQNDITDSVLWAISQGIVDKERVAITGISFGGFCTLSGITFTPELYKCAAELVGPSQLFTVTTNIVPYWKPKRKILNDRVVDLSKDEELNKSRSPIFHVEKVSVPLIMANGGNDIVVNTGESVRMYQALKASGKQVEYLVYEDEGHWLERPVNKMDWFWRVEKLLHKCLGGPLGPPPPIPVDKCGAVMVSPPLQL